MRRGPSGSQPKPHGRPIKALNGVLADADLIYFLCYRHSFWDALPQYASLSTKRVWEFYLSEAAWKRARSRIEGERIQGTKDMTIGCFRLSDVLNYRLTHHLGRAARTAAVSG